MKCERCNKQATQADTYQNEWLCDDCYSMIGILTDDYQAKDIDWDLLENMTAKELRYAVSKLAT